MRMEREHLAFLAGEFLFLRAAGEEPLERTVHRRPFLAFAHQQREQVRGMGIGLARNDNRRNRHWSGAFYSVLPVRWEGFESAPQVVQVGRPPLLSDLRADRVRAFRSGQTTWKT